MSAILVPHCDDEMIFLWTRLRRATMIGVLVDAGYTRSMECRDYFARLQPNTKLTLYRLQEPLPQAARWDQIEFDDLPELDADQVDSCCRHFCQEARRAGIPNLIIPGGLATYPHPHHRQLQDWCDENLSVFVGEGLVELDEKRRHQKQADVLTTYASETPGFLRGGRVLEVLTEGVDIERVYKLEW